METRKSPRYFNSATSMICLLILGSFFTSINAQNDAIEAVSEMEANVIIEKIVDSLEKYYVSLDMGVKIGASLLENRKNGLYQSISDPEDLAKQLTKDLRSLNGDLHLSVGYKRKSDDKPKGNESGVNEKYGKSTNYGFQEIKFLDDNVVYIKISHFSNWDFASEARQRISEIMGLLKNSETFIIDVRDNPGGVAFIVSYLCSYFFEDEEVHLADVYSRFDGYSYGIFTEPLVPGIKYPDVPIFVLVNENSHSGAEEFAFWLQNKNRATIIGQTTAGAGYGAMTHTLNERFSVSISSEDYLDSGSQKGFQGVGVMPDIVVDKGLEFSTALQLAKDSVNGIAVKDSSLVRDFYSLLQKQRSSISEVEIFENVMLLHQLGFLGYDEIEELGKKYINEPHKALPILRANTVLYSFYPQPFDLYAEALAKADRYQMALRNYDKAVQLAELKSNPGLTEIMGNREQFLQEYGSLLDKN